MFNHFSVRVMIPLFPVIIAGCTTVGPEHKVPEVPVGKGWITLADNNTNSASLAVWWRSIGDPVLDDIVERALKHNLDIRQADLNIEASKALLLKAESLSTPTVTANGGVQRRELSRNSPEYNPQRSQYQTINDAGLDASWEIDLFGGLRRQREAAEAYLQVTEAEATGLRISIVAETVRTYFALQGAQRELAARQASVDSLQHILLLTKNRYKAGDLPVAEVERVQSRADQAKALLPPIQARRQNAAIALGLLTGDLPESLMSLTSRPPTDFAFQAIPVGQRADILRRRPDVLAAERKLAAATGETGVATAELFPKLSLTASAGFRALSDSTFLSTDSRRSAIGGLISWRIFDGGRVRAEIKAAEARQQAAAVGYEKAVLSALSDAEKALNQYEHSRLTIMSQETAVASINGVANTTRKRYDLGDASLIELLDIERELDEQQALLAQHKTTAASDMVTLFKTLGGGWEKGK